MMVACRRPVVPVAVVRSPYIEPGDRTPRQLRTQAATGLAATIAGRPDTDSGTGPPARPGPF